MIDTLKAEFKKILTVRSTYVIIAFCVAMLLLFAFYIQGYRQPADIKDPGLLASEVTSAIEALVLFISLIGLLLVTHEYRYNTIAYTLVSSKSRLKVLLAKIIAVSVVALVLTIIFCTLSPLLTYAGIQLKGLSIVPQVIPLGDIVWKVLFFAWGFSMLAMLIAAFVRSQVGAIVAFLLFPATVEPLLGLLLKHNAVYLPYSLLNNVLHPTTITQEKAALVFAGYVVVGWIVAGLLFLRRDAS